MGKYFWRNKERNETNHTRLKYISKINVSSSCALRNSEKWEPEFIQQSGGLQVKEKKKKKDQTEPTSSSGTEIRSTGETECTLFTDTNSSNESHERFDDEPVTILS